MRNYLSQFNHDRLLLQIIFLACRHLDGEDAKYLLHVCCMYRYLCKDNHSYIIFTVVESVITYLGLAHDFARLADPGDKNKFLALRFLVIGVAYACIREGRL